MRPELLSGKEPVLRPFPPAAFFPVPAEDVLKASGELDPAGIAALADFLGNGHDPVREGNIPEPEGDHLAQPQGCAVSGGECGHLFDVLCAYDDRHDIRFGGNFRKRMVHPAQGQVIICKRPSKNKAEILFQGAVIDVDGPWCIAQPAVSLTSDEMQEECAQMRDIRIVKTDAVVGIKPYTAFKD